MDRENCEYCLLPNISRLGIGQQNQALLAKKKESDSCERKRLLVRNRLLKAAVALFFVVITGSEGCALIAARCLKY